MALFTKFFKPDFLKPDFLKPDFLKPKWQHDDADIRRQAIAELTAREDLLTLLEHEPLAELRQLAVSRFTNEADFETLLTHNHADVRNSARQQWLQQILSQHPQIENISDNTTLIRIASLTDDTEQRLQAIARITDQDERLQLAIHNPVAKVRLAAAQGIEDADKLQQLLQHAQGKDKAVYRFCKERLNANKAQQQAQQAQAEKIQALLASAQQLNRLGYNPEFNSRYQVLSKDWASLNQEARDDQATQIETELTQAATTLQQHAAEEARQAQAKAASEQAQQQQQQLLQQLSALLDETIQAAPNNLAEQITELEQHWREAASQHKTSGEHHRQFENQLQQLLTMQTALAHHQEKHSELQRWLDSALPDDVRGLNQLNKHAQQWQKQLPWPAGIQAPAWLTDIANKEAQAKAQLQQLADQQKSRLQTINEQLTKLEQALDEGHAKEASKLNQQLQQNLRQVDSQHSQTQQRQAKTLLARLNEMRDWQGFATTPKKEALCVEMENLINTDLAADALADKIHDLQEQWKALHSSQPDRELWQRFQAAGDKAFEPCRAYFADVAEQRQQRVAARQALTAELTHYEQQLDWNTADWKTVQKTLEAAREAFRGFSPVDRASHKTTQAEFQTACDAIYAHLKAEYDRNLMEKKALVERAEACTQQTDISSAIDGVKALQQEWKTIGVTPRNPDQKLWKQFRGHCDAVFARLNDEKAERKAVINQAVTEAEALVAQAQTLTKELTAEEITSTSAITTAQETLAALNQQFAAIELPKSAHQRLVKQLQACDTTLKNQRQQLKHTAEKARWNGLVDRLNAVANQDVEAFAAASELPAGYNATLFEQALAGEMNTNADAQAIAIAMEVLADIESPDSDKARRMELQVQKLAQGLGQGLGKDAERQQLVEQWLQTEPTAEQQSRFIAALMGSL